MEAKGKKLLKVCGVLLIIEGIAGILSYGLLTLIMSAGTVIDKVSGGAAATAIAAMYLIAAIISLVTGILGVKNDTGSGLAGKRLILGVINLVLTLAAGLWSFAGEGNTFLHYLYTSLGLIIPSLYIAGVYMSTNE